MRVDLIPLRDAASELDCSTTMVRRAWRDGVLKLVQAGRGLAIERAELERAKHEHRCREPGCDTMTLGKTGYCEPHRGKANRGKSIADGTRAPTSQYRISDAERDRRRAAIRAVTEKVRTDPTAHQAVLEHRQATRRQTIHGEKATAGEVVLETAEVAARVGRAAATVTEHVGRGWAQPALPGVALPGRPPFLWTEEAVKAYEQALGQHGDGRLVRFAGKSKKDDRHGQRKAEEFVARWGQRCGHIDPSLPIEAAMAIVRPSVKAKRSVYRFNAGDRRARRKEELHAEWRRRFYKLRRDPNWSNRSDWEICVFVADEHIREHPGDWSKYEQHPDGGLRPEDERRAAQRVWDAIQ